MPPRKINKKTPQKVNIPTLVCTMCGKTKKSKDYYQSFNPIHATGKLPYCKDCLKKMCQDSNGNVDIEKTKQMLKMIDRPFFYKLFKTSCEDKGDTIGIYMKNIGMHQYRDLGWSASELNAVCEDKERSNILNNNFIITDEIILKWGSGYQTDEYQAFERKYELLKNNYPEKTSMHTEALLKYIRYSVKEEMATACNDVGAAKSWGQLAKDAATAAKINPSQLSKADLSDGLSTFSELSQALEREVDIIPILPRFKYRPNDALDFNIWCYVNYMRDLQGLPPCKYEDIYAFYDRRKQEYIKQYGDPYGIFVDDTTESNRENIKKFIKEEGE